MNKIDFPFLFPQIVWYARRYNRKLKRLNLGGNELTSVPQKSLSILDMLKKLEIQENKIKVIREGDFEGLYIVLSPLYL